MEGCRHFTDTEILRVRRCLARKHYTGKRDVAWFLLGLTTGYRISEILAVRRGDLIHGGRLVKYLRITTQHMKTRTRQAYLPEITRKALRRWIGQLSAQGWVCHSDYVFQSHSRSNRPLSRSRCWQIIHEAARSCGCTGTIGTHSMRKTYAIKMEANQGLRVTQLALGHKDINTTLRYLNLEEEKVTEGVQAIWGR